MSNLSHEQLDKITIECLSQKVERMHQEIEDLIDKKIELKSKIEVAKQILIGHCSGYYHCQKNCYDELKEALTLPQKEEKPYCFGCFPHKVPPMMEDCYKNCKGSIVLCKKATHEKEEQEISFKNTPRDGGVPIKLNFGKKEEKTE